MIKYSVAMRKNMGKDKATKPQKAYANVQLTDIVTLDGFARHIASHGSVYNRGDIYNVLVQAVDCLKELVLEGKKVSLGDLGSFSPQIASTGMDTPSDFTAANITKTSMKWSKGNALKNFRSDATFEVVASRVNQALIVTAEKAGATSVQLAEKNAPAGGGSGGNSGE
jgi:predicted histone-like DNA-binding protein